MVKDQEQEDSQEEKETVPTEEDAEAEEEPPVDSEEVPEEPQEEPETETKKEPQLKKFKQSQLNKPMNNFEKILTFSLDLKHTWTQVTNYFKNSFIFHCWVLNFNDQIPSSSSRRRHSFNDYGKNIWSLFGRKSNTFFKFL